MQQKTPPITNFHSKLLLIIPQYFTHDDSDIKMLRPKLTSDFNMIVKMLRKVLPILMHSVWFTELVTDFLGN